MNKSSKERIQDKIDLLHDLRERDIRALDIPEQMLESDLDKEIAYRESNRSFESTESVLSDIRNGLLRLEQKVEEEKKPLTYIENDKLFCSFCNTALSDISEENEDGGEASDSAVSG